MLSTHGILTNGNVNDVGSVSYKPTVLGRIKERRAGVVC